MAATLARRRLGQAEYFLQQAESNRFNRELFATYLEAFIAFSRSVLHILYNEVEAAGVESCFQPGWDALDKEPLPQFFRDIRDMVLKEGEDPAHARHNLTVFAGMTAQAKVNILVQRADGTAQAIEVEPELPKPPEQLPAGITEHTVRYFFNEGALKDQDVLEKCREYLKRLEQAIAVAEQCGA